MCNLTHKRKLIEVALPIEAINTASAREKSIRHGHPSTLHLAWARRPLAAARARAIVMETERKLGFEPTDRDIEQVGYDIESRVPGTGKLRFIEVK